MTNLERIKGFLFDLDGVLYIGSECINGAIDTINEVRRRKYCCRFITNTSTMSSAALLEKLLTLGFEIGENEIFSAPIAARDYIGQFNDPACRLLLMEGVQAEFKAFRQTEDQPDFIVVGDIGGTWSYELLNSVFKQLMQGAKLIAIHKNRFWQTEQGLQMDIGGFISALEYASGQQALVIGKPAREFFNRAILSMGLPAIEVAIIGDDIDSDIKGGQDAGLTGILVRTGKYRRHYAEQTGVNPNYVVDSIADLPLLLNKP